ncbi:hypothetical protein [Colwellia sp. Arc7-D]|uniref:hypothetical protein n=1 Tax=Colwellia sp. Arc7-D TaxID=2161872 RepID=UPI000D33E67C|nr:hypothetical protein [Colwellia sp. Arc7-D]AWB56766.1 hypothetical protein DBO93_03785 [Colwellia sp. Arc7-D]
MLINKKAKDRLIDTFNENTIMHDWWVLLFASLHENVHFIDIATLMYRQHDDNSIGASKKIGMKAIINKAINGHVNIKKAFLQSNSFYNSLEKDELKLLTESQNYLFSFYRNYSQLSFYQRLKFCLKTAPLKSTLTKNIYTKAILLLGLK